MESGLMQTDSCIEDHLFHRCSVSERDLVGIIVSVYNVISLTKNEADNPFCKSPSLLHQAY